jgi:ApbE superfamily uncharacterized protein (UPF0280 family)
VTRRPQVAVLPGGRLHLQDGPIDLVLTAQARHARAAERTAFAAATVRLTGLLDRLCDHLGALRAPSRPRAAPLSDPVAQRMQDAVAPYAGTLFVTPMAAVAGAVAEAVLAAMTAAATLDRAIVNNGGDIAFHLAPGETVTAAMIDRPDRPSLVGRVAIDAASPVRGIATSGWRGRSFSLGIADAVTVLAGRAADADVAATLIANAVDLPGHPAITRVPAVSLQPDSDLGSRLVTRAVGPLTAAERDAALAPAIAFAGSLVRDGRIAGAALHLQGETRVVGAAQDARQEIEA